MDKETRFEVEITGFELDSEFNLEWVCYRSKSNNPHHKRVKTKWIYGKISANKRRIHSATFNDVYFLKYSKKTNVYYFMAPDDGVESVDDIVWTETPIKPKLHKYELIDGLMDKVDQALTEYHLLFKPIQSNPINEGSQCIIAKNVES